MAEAADDYEPGDDYDPEAESVDWGGAGKKLNLPEVPILTGEEEDDIVAKYRCKLYRWVKSEWKERGAGDIKFLKNKATGKIRIVHRQDKTHKVVANFYISGAGLCSLSKSQTNDKSWIWSCYDFSDTSASVQKLCGRFVNKEDCDDFQKQWEKAYTENSTLVKSAGEGKAEEKKEDTPATTETAAATTAETTEKKD